MIATNIYNYELLSTCKIKLFQQYRAALCLLVHVAGNFCVIVLISKDENSLEFNDWA